MNGKWVELAMAWAMVVFPQPAGPPTIMRGIDPREELCGSWDGIVVFERVVELGFEVLGLRNRHEVHSGCKVTSPWNTGPSHERTQRS